MARKKIALIGGRSNWWRAGTAVRPTRTRRRRAVRHRRRIAPGEMPRHRGSRPGGRVRRLPEGTNNYADIAGSDVVIVTAGLPRKPGMSRDDLIGVNSKIMSQVAEGIKTYAPNSFVIVISNPLDAMVTLCQKITGSPTTGSSGQAGVLDSARFAAFIAWELGVSVRDVTAMTLGGHGDDMVPPHPVRLRGRDPVMELLERKYGNATKAKGSHGGDGEPDPEAGGEVVALLKTGSGLFSPASAAIAMVESILKDQKRVLPCCVYLNGEFGVKGYFVGVPTVLGAGGVGEGDRVQARRRGTGDDGQVSRRREGIGRHSQVADPRTDRSAPAGTGLPSRPAPFSQNAAPQYHPIIDTPPGERGINVVREPGNPERGTR